MGNHLRFASRLPLRALAAGEDDEPADDKRTDGYAQRVAGNRKRTRCSLRVFKRGQTRVRFILIRGELLFELRVLRFQILILLRQALNRGECDTLRVDGADGRVVLADLERRGKVLRHRSDVADGCILRRIVPRGDGERVNLREHRAGIDVREISFKVLVGQIVPRAGAGVQCCATCRGGVGVERDAAGGADEKLIVDGRADIGRRRIIAPNECASLIVRIGVLTGGKTIIT